MKAILASVFLAVACCAFAAGNQYVGKFTGDGSGLTNIVGIGGGQTNWPLESITNLQGVASLATNNAASLTNIPGGAIVSAVAQATHATNADLATLATAATTATTATKSSFADDVSTNKLPSSAITNAPWATTTQLADATNHTVPASLFPALTGDVTNSAGSLATGLKATGTAGTYTKVTFDDRGRETSGTTLSAGDIPTLTVAKLSDAGTAAYSNATAFALSQSGNIVTQNNSFSLVLSNAVKMDAAHSLSLSNLTASRVVLSGADNGLSSAAASGAVPIDADGSATTFAQVNALAPGTVVTNGLASAVTLSNALTVRGLLTVATNTDGANFLQRYDSGNGAVELRNSGDSAFVPLLASGFLANGATPALNQNQLSLNKSEINQSSFRGVRRIVNLTSDAGISWSSTTTISAQDDLGLVRDGTTAGVLAVTNNSAASTYAGVIQVYGIYPTNYVAANFAPIAGMVKIVVSNGVLWKVTQLTTNLISANTP